MIADSEDSKPMLASLVQSGDQQTEAIAINDFIFMAKDISNAYLVNTDEGDIMINSGFVASAERNKAVFKPVRTGPLKAIILTQAHADHFGGVPEFLEPGTKIIAERRFSDTCGYFTMLDAYLRRRSGKLWTGTIKRRDIVVPKVVPDIIVDGEYSFESGGRTFRVISTPGGEAPDSVVVWMPGERIVFTGNLFGPVFLSVPNLCTTRGDKPRSARLYLECLDKVRQLGVETLITGHGDPIVGADKVRADLDKMHAAVSYIHDKTVEGMNAGVDVHTLMAEIRLPEEITIGEYHGKVNWAVRTIWEEYSGWFHMDSTTSLYAVPRSSVNGDLVALAGGAEAIAIRAAEKVRLGKPLEALHLLDISLGADPGHGASLSAKKEALGQLLKASGGTNLSEVMWLKSEIAAVERALNPGQD
jgi:alkyl sulfatase BDS1-like metallo-beta-lactamase superfamily hydrolase